jgi:hypothetical protein
MAMQPPEEVVGDRLARWRHLTGRAIRIEFLMSGITVRATTPEELVDATDAEIVRRTRNQPES